MAIQINPNRINTPGSRPQGADARRQQPAQSEARPAKPNRQDLNYIPEGESLATLIRSAIAAFRQGVTWDRGTILNLLV